MNAHRTHTGEVVTGERLQVALGKVAADWRELSHGSRRQDLYALHVTEAQKDDNLRKDLLFADQIEAGEATGFTIWQRVNTELTGDCVALLAV